MCDPGFGVVREDPCISVGGAEEGGVTIVVVVVVVVVTATITKSRVGPAVRDPSRLVGVELSDGVDRGFVVETVIKLGRSRSRSRSGSGSGSGRGRRGTGGG